MRLAEAWDAQWDLLKDMAMAAVSD